jgi:hypothetical protein
MLARVITVSNPVSAFPGNERGEARDRNPAFPKGRDGRIDQMADDTYQATPAVSNFGLMFNLQSPNIFIPVHGERQASVHVGGEFAREVVGWQLWRKRLFVADIGYMLSSPGHQGIMQRKAYLRGSSGGRAGE